MKLLVSEETINNMVLRSVSEYCGLNEEEDIFTLLGKGIGTIGRGAGKAYNFVKNKINNTNNNGNNNNNQNPRKLNFVSKFAFKYGISNLKEFNLFLNVFLYNKMDFIKSRFNEVLKNKNNFPKFKNITNITSIEQSLNKNYTINEIYDWIIFFSGYDPVALYKEYKLAFVKDKLNKKERKQNKKNNLSK